jgi:5-formyltetrahydrofolate cyclo-ligase
LNSAVPVAPEKAQWRRELRAARAAIAPAAARQHAIRAARNLMRLASLRRARHFAVYLAAGSELDTDVLIRALHRTGKRVLVPAIAPGPDSAMRMIPLDPHAPLRRRRHGIREPARRRRDARSRVDVLVLPLRGFDSSGTRLGSGAGYYDRWLARQRPRPFCIGFAYALQEVDALPREPWDQPLDAICTERGLRYFWRR